MGFSPIKVWKEILQEESYISFRLVVLVATLIPLRAIARSALHALISNTP
jgi:hypothetical protein